MNLVNGFHGCSRYIRGPVFRSLCTSSAVCSNNLNRQAKIFRKLLGNKEAGSKKRWYPSQEDALPKLQNPLSLTKTKTGGKNASRRVAVLNKLFMTYITDLMATGSVSQEILGRSVAITRVSITTDFQIVNVFWIGREDGEFCDTARVLSKCGGAIRHELSQLRLLGQVPKIHFVKDKMFARGDEVDNLLKKCELDSIEDQEYIINKIKSELNLEYESKPNVDYEEDSSSHKPQDPPEPEMRCDIFGLNHTDIMNKIITKMKKSKQAWEVYEHGLTTSSASTPIYSSIPVVESSYLNNNERTTSQNVEFEKFLQKRKFRKSKKHRNIYYFENEVDFTEEYEETNQKFDEEDYIIEEFENQKM